MGIGPKNYGGAGMKSGVRECGTPINMKDLSGDGKVTQKDVLIGRGVIEAPTLKRGCKY